jgi:mono/diheme cytochrome c family protein
MKRILNLSSSILAALAILSVFAAQAVAQFHRGAAQPKVDVAAYPAGIQHGYRVFADKCSECHELSLSLKVSRSEAGWTQEVRRMQDMASSHIDDREADQIAKFLAYNDSHRPAEQNTSAGAGGEPSDKELFDKLSCSACHSIAGAGNTSFPLDGIGSRRTASELKKQIMSPATGSAMPATTASEAEIDSLVAYLVTLKNP